MPKEQIHWQKTNLRSSRTAKQTAVFYQPFQPHSPRNPYSVPVQIHLWVSDRPHFCEYKTHPDTAELSSRVDFRTFSHSQGVAPLQKSPLSLTVAPFTQTLLCPLGREAQSSWRVTEQAKAVSLGCCKDIAAEPFLLGILLKCICQSLHGFGHRGLQRRWVNSDYNFLKCFIEEVYWTNSSALQS